MIGRRALLCAAACSAAFGRAGAAAMAASPVPRWNRLAFDVVREDNRIGTHVLTFAHRPDGFDIAIAVDIAVGIGPLVLFRYTLKGLEQWRNGQVAHVEATTDDDGSPQWMRADRGPAGLRVQGSKTQPYVAPDDALPATHWNMAELNGPWINPQDGRLFRPKIAPLGVEPVKLADGQSERAAGFAASGDVHLDLWYDETKRWSALRFNAKDGSVVRYELA